MKFLFIVAFTCLTQLSFSQTIEALASKPKISLRGLSAATDNVVWASGSSGTVARSVDGGKTWNWQTVAGYEKRDFRDIEAFDASTAIIMAIDEPAVILKTKNGGKSWQKVFEDSTKGMFLDAMDFDGRNGVVIGDPIQGNMFLAETHDLGDHWMIAKDKVPLDTGEAFFASSGTNIKMLPAKGNRLAYLAVSGGTKSSLLTGQKQKLDLIQGKNSQGANSIAYGKNILIVGGDFANDKDTTGNCVITENLGKTWLRPQTPPHGYRSCVIYLNANTLLTCGTSGVDVSTDGGVSWKLISDESFHVCTKAKKGTAVFLAGKDGRIAKLSNLSLL